MVLLITSAAALVAGLLGCAIGYSVGHAAGVERGYTQGWRDHDATTKPRRGPDGKFTPKGGI